MLSSAHRRGVVSAREAAAWALPEGGVDQQRRRRRAHGGLRLSNCEKCLAVAISVPGRRLGVIAVADKESRDGGVLDFTATDARASLALRQPGRGAIETARLHQGAIEKERIERELELAAAIQREILPRALPDVAGVEIAAPESADAAGRRRLLRLLPAVGRTARRFSSRTSRARACRRRSSCRPSTRRFTSRSTRRRRSPT